MTIPEAEFSPPPRRITAGRILFGVGGLLALLVGTLITVGGALIGVLGIGIVWLVMRHRKRRLTRLAAWLASAGATVAALLVLIAIGALMQPSSPNLTPEQERAAQARMRDSMPEWLKKMTPANPRQNAAADSMAQKLVQNKPVMVWFATMSAVVGASFLGAIIGTIAWGSIMMLARAFTGEWLPRQQISPT